MRKSTSSRLALLVLAASAWPLEPAFAADDAAPKSGGGAYTVGRHEHEVVLTKIAVTDIMRSYRFYTEVVGLKSAVPEMKPPEPGDNLRNGYEFLLNYTGALADPFLVLIKQQGQVPTPETARLTTIGFRVPDVSAAIDKAEAAGATVIRRPRSGPHVNGVVTDPDGYMVEFLQPARSP